MKTAVTVLAVALAATQCLASPPPDGGFACPDCDLDQTANFTCLINPSPGASYSPIGGSSRLCLRPPAGFVSCENKKRFVDPGLSVFNLTTSDDHCGKCGNKCTGDTPHCDNGKCACIVGQQVVDNTTVRCDPASGKLVKCPALRGNCDNSLLDAGVEGDCETPLATDMANCGACGEQCLSNTDRCLDGKCSCGTTAGNQCEYPKEFCVNGECRECAAPDNDYSTCSKQSVLQDSKFCDVTGSCAKCPTGWGDCEATNSTGDPDFGAPSDCETFLGGSGQNVRCGTCRNNCNRHDKMTCCSGQCLCGKFTNLTDPIAGECAAAVQCSTTEYCDGTLGKCLPLLPGNEVCTGTAGYFTDDDFYLYATNSNRRICGSCNETLSRPLVKNHTCQHSNSKQCGASGIKCKEGQLCLKGICRCQQFVASEALSWKPYIDRDPDHDNKYNRYIQPASGCGGLITDFLDFSFDRVQYTLLSFIECITRSNLPEVTIVTPADFKNETFRAMVCPGGPGKCPASFCHSLHRNFTGSDRTFFCSIAKRTAEQLKRCSQSVRALGNTEGDLECANTNAYMRNQFAGPDLEWFDLYSFLGCEQPRDDFELIVARNNRAASLPYRVQTVVALLGASSPITLSLMVAIVSMVGAIVAVYL